MSEIALQLIAENKTTKAKMLDIGNCGLTELPQELFDCVWLEELNLGAGRLELEDVYGRNNRVIEGDNFLPVIDGNIRKLTFLKKLQCEGIGISDISFLKNLTQLTSLRLDSNQIVDISVLQYCQNLEYLNLDNNQISDITSLKSLEKLRLLRLSKNNISDCSSLSQLLNLHFLGLGYNRISDVSFVESLLNLEELWLANNQISDIAALKNLTNLNFLDLSGNRIDDIEPLLPLLKKGLHSYLHKNPLKNPPIEIVTQKKKDVIIRYFEKKIEIVNNKVKSFKIRDFRGITETQVENIPNNTSWIFLTGENGFGKTSVLQALAKGLTGEGYLVLEDEENKSITQKIVAYGSSRLRVSAGTSTEVVSKYSAIDSLMSNETPLINIEERLKDWERNYENGFLQLEALFKALLPRLGRIAVKFNESTRSSEVKYYETDDAGQFYGDGVTFEQLAAGFKNIIAMIGDMVYRLSLNQDVASLSDLEGIVLVDEIELHLHAKYQKIFIEKLTELFPKIQFIVSTHSPIPLLGAPKNTVVINVSRTFNEGIQAELLDIDFSSLTPNAILSSPIFGFQELIPVSKSPDKMINTADKFEDIALDKRLKENINAFLSEESQQELLNLINAK